MNGNIIALPRDDSGQSPFDSIRQVRDDDSEYWSARDLMSLMGYARWEDFYKVTRRAEASARNTGDAEGFAEITEKPLNGRPRINYHLSRYAAYLVAMNGEPNMPEVAAAQGYFAIRTREAEVRDQPKELTYIEKVNALLIEGQERIAELTAENQVLKPESEAWRGLSRAIGDFCISDAAKIVARVGCKTGPGRLHKLIEHEWKWMFRRGEKKKRVVYQGAVDKGWMVARITSGYFDQVTGERKNGTPEPRVTVEGIGEIARRLGGDPEAAMAEACNDIHNHEAEVTA